MAGGISSIAGEAKTALGTDAASTASKYDCNMVIEICSAIRFLKSVEVTLLNLARCCVIYRRNLTAMNLEVNQGWSMKVERLAAYLPKSVCVWPSQ